MIRRPNLVGALVGKASAVVKISSQSAASRAKHLRDFDSLARMLGPVDRAEADLTKGEKKLLMQASSLLDPAGLSSRGIALLAGRDGV